MIRRRSSFSARALLPAALLAASALLPGAAAGATPRVSLLPADSVRASMVGVGYTVFQGTKIDTFSIVILGVLRDYRPGGSLILGRASNPYLDKTGIIAGMSGSPIYVGGRLIGAISYTWGFLKEPLAGITPIAEMLDVLPGDEPRPENRDDLRLGALAPDPGAPERDAPALASGAEAAWPGSRDGIRPIGTPVMVSGFAPEALRFLDPWFRDRGLVAVPGGAPSGRVSCDSLVPGSSVGVQLIRGDWNIAAIGTVTYRDRDRLLAFGHPFTSMGWVDFPITGAEIYTVMSSAQFSNKVGAATAPCGAMTADRIAAIAGSVGPAPAMIPVRVAVRGSGGRARDYRFEVVRNRLITPGLVSGAVVSSISSALHDVGTSTVRYEFTSYWNGGSRRLERGDVILSNAPLSGVGEEISQSLTLLLGERFRPSRLDSASVVVSVEEGIDALALTDIHLSPSTVAPGDSVAIEATFRRSSRDTEIRRFWLRIPLSAPEGDLTVRVCDGGETERWEQSRVPQRYQPRTLDDLMALYRDERKSDHLYAQLYAEATGTVVNGKEIARAPASVLSVLGYDPKKGDGGAVKGATLAERDFPLQHVVNGCETATITVSANRRR